MIIELASIVDRSKELNVSFDDVDLDSEDARSAGPIVFAGEMVRVENKPHIRGVVTAAIDVNCTRCMAKVIRDSSIEIDESFVEPYTEGETEIENLNEQVAIDGQVDLKEMLRDIVILDLPEQVYCREDCKGLCSKCGADLNLIDCNCNDQSVDPRWEALKGLK